MEVESIVQSARRLLGLLGVGLLAYAAGYTRGYIHASEMTITVDTKLISLGAIPTWIGLTAFTGMGLIFLYLLITAVDPRFNSRE